MREKVDKDKKKRSKFKRIFKKRPCRLCRNKVEAVDYKDVEFLQRFVTDRAKIMPSRLSGNCAKHQRMIANRIKIARITGLLPFIRIKQGTQRERYSSPRR